MSVTWWVKISKLSHDTECLKDKFKLSAIMPHIFVGADFFLISLYCVENGCRQAFNKSNYIINVIFVNIAAYASC